MTAILIRSASPLYSPGLHQAINEGNVAQAVFPIREVASLFEGLVGNVQLLLLALAGMVVVVSALGMMVSLYNSMNDRRREIGIMRALGARRATVLWVILLESVLLSLGGGLLGLVLGHGGVTVQVVGGGDSLKESTATRSIETQGLEDDDRVVPLPSMPPSDKCCTGLWIESTREVGRLACLSKGPGR